MGLVKKILKSEALRATLCWLGAMYIRLVWLTSRWEIENVSVPQAFWRDNKPFVITFWHGHLLMMNQCWDMSKPIHMLISQHRDGRIVARVIGHLGIQSIAGSSSRGGASAVRQMVKTLKAGEYVGITPDGPRGPRMRTTEGVVQVARMAGVPIIPSAYSVRNRRVLRSWDRFQVALPFTRGIILWGEPIDVPRTLDAAGIEAKRAEVEAKMIALAQQAERRMGHTPTEPADPVPARRPDSEGPER